LDKFIFKKKIKSFGTLLGIKTCRGKTTREKAQGREKPFVAG
jgi:hypothetical protein